MTLNVLGVLLYPPTELLGVELSNRYKTLLFIFSRCPYTERLVIHNMSEGSPLGAEMDHGHFKNTVRYRPLLTTWTDRQTDRQVGRQTKSCYGGNNCKLMRNMWGVVQTLNVERVS